jgi:Domain of unknown function (DUF4124)
MVQNDKAPESSPRTRALATIALLICATPALAQTLYRYVDERGKIYYSDKPMTHMTGRPTDQLTRQGTVIRRDPAAPTVEQRAAADAEKRKRAETDKVQSVEQRRNLALLATYATEKEIDDAQAFALRDPIALVKETEEQLAATEKRRNQHRSDVEKLGAKASQQQRDHLRQSELDVKSVAEVLETKRRDVQLINDRYEEDRRRYLEIVRQRQAMLNSATGAAAGGVTVSPASSSAAR